MYAETNAAKAHKLTETMAVALIQGDWRDQGQKVRKATWSALEARGLVEFQEDLGRYTQTDAGYQVHRDISAELHGEEDPTVQAMTKGLEAAESAEDAPEAPAQGEDAAQLVDRAQREVERLTNALAVQTGRVRRELKARLAHAKRRLAAASERRWLVLGF